MEPKTKPNATCARLAVLASVILALLPLLSSCISVQEGKTSSPSALTMSPAATSRTVSASETPALLSATQPAPSRSTSVVEGSTKQILNLLNSDNLCELPCFWSVTPGEKWIAAEERLKEFVVYIGETAQGNGDILHEIPSNVAFSKQGITFSIAIRERAGAVESIAGQINSTRFSDTLKPLTPQQVALAYGVPTSIRLLVSTDNNSAGAGYYHLWSLYSDKDFYVLYMGYAPKIGATYEICPSVQHLELSPVAASSGYTAQSGGVMFGSVRTKNEAALEAIAIEADDTFTQSRAINEVTTLSDAALVELIKHDGTKGCFTTPLSVWEH
jgi:hypothetical protein